MKVWRKIKKLPLPVLCYGLCVLIWLVGGVGALGRDLLATQSGQLYPFDQEAADFQLVDLHQQQDGSYLTETADPQLLWTSQDGRAIRTLRVESHFSRAPREICLYYTTAPGQAFGKDRAVYPQLAADGSYVYRLPAVPVTALRLDPCSPQEGLPIEVQFGTFHFNEKLPLWRYFAPGWAGLFGMLAGPALAASVLSLITEALIKRKNKM